MKRSLAVLFAVVLGVLSARPASAHIVNVGVGTQTWFELRPRKLIVRYNLGFSTLKGYPEMIRADANKDGKVSRDEEGPYLEGLIKRVLPQLRFHLDGKPVALRFLHGEAYGLQGMVSQTPFDTFFDLEADVNVGPGPHELVYYEGTYEGDVAQQILHVVLDHASDFSNFNVEQKNPGPPAVEEGGALTLQGRDVTVSLEFDPKALERDKAEALLEPCMEGMQATVDMLATNVARSTEDDLRVLPVGDVRLGMIKPSFATQKSGFNISAPTAKNRDGSETSSSPSLSAAPEGASGKFRSKDVEDKEKMEDLVRKPFAILAILVFFAWGAVHATTPGHGKTMVAAYLLGTKGRVWDAVRLGLIVTFTHTFTLYTFGLGLVGVTYYMQVSQDVLYQRSTFFITLASGVGLWLFGLTLAWRRSRASATAAPSHGHDHAHDHSHGHDHSHAPAPLPEKLEAPKTGKKLGLVMAAPAEAPVAPAHAHTHDGHTHTHSHGGHSHSHGDMSEDEHAALHAREAATEISSFSDLLKLGVVGGILPCPAGVFLILSSIGGHLPPLNVFVYLNAFSLGLGSVIIGIATAMVFSKRFLDRALTSGGGRGRRILAVLPVVSAVLVSFVGLGIAYSAWDPNFERAKARLSAFVASKS